MPSRGVHTLLAAGDSLFHLWFCSEFSSFTVTNYCVWFRRDNSSFKKFPPRSGNTVFIKGFDSSSGEDQVILSSFCYQSLCSFLLEQYHSILHRALCICQIRSALEGHFASCGEITRISIPKDYETGASKGSVLHISMLYI